MNPKIDIYLDKGCMRCSLGDTPQCKVKKWPEELTNLRRIVLDCGLTEELKWGVPCYTFQKNNIVLISAFKEYCVLSFFKGALLKDTNKILIKPGDNTQSARSIRFINLQEVIGIETVLKSYIQEAIEIEKSGLKVEFKKVEEFPIPEEFQSKLDNLPALKASFEALTPGRQRAYLLHFSAPKQSKTRESRIEKCIQQILDGKGLND